MAKLTYKNFCSEEKYASHEFINKILPSLISYIPFLFPFILGIVEEHSRLPPATAVQFSTSKFAQKLVAVAGMEICLN
jgi:hypothetical protein